MAEVVLHAINLDDHAVDGLVALPTVAVVLKISWGQAYELLTRGVLGAPVRRGSRWFLRRDAVERYIHATQMPGRPEVPA